MNYDGIIIGGGPAGMFAAITTAERGQRVLLLERNDRLGKKLLITGKGRCNVTNDCTGQEILQNTPRNGRFLYSAMTAFPPEKTMAFFEEHGCALKTERGNRVFPVTDKSQSVLECLQRELRRLGVTVKNARVKHILAEDGQVTGVETQNETIPARWDPCHRRRVLSHHRLHRRWLYHGIGAGTYYHPRGRKSGASGNGGK